MANLTGKGRGGKGKDLPVAAAPDQVEGNAHVEPGDGQVGGSGTDLPAVATGPRQRDLAALRAVLTGQSVIIRK